MKLIFVPPVAVYVFIFCLKQLYMKESFRCMTVCNKNSRLQNTKASLVFCPLSCTQWKNAHLLEGPSYLCYKKHAFSDMGINLGGVG